MTRTRQPNLDALNQSQDTTPQSLRKAFPSVIERFLRFIENAQRRSHKALIGRVLEEKAVLLKSQAKAVMARRPEMSGAPISFEGERRELNRKGKSILIVDDEKNIRLTLFHALDVLQAETDMAVDGNEALAKLKTREYGLILLDLRLPDMNGMDVLRQIREIRPDIRVIMMTAYGTIESAVEAMKVGACDFIQKPFLPEEIRNLVSRVMDSEKFDEQKALDYASSIELAKRSVGDRHFEAALEHVRKAISLDPNRPEAFNLLGALMEIQGDCMEAQKKYRAALSLDPSYKPALENLRRSTTPYPKQKGLVSLGLQTSQKEKA